MIIIIICSIISIIWSFIKQVIIKTSIFTDSLRCLVKYWLTWLSKGKLITSWASSAWNVRQSQIQTSNHSLIFSSLPENHCIHQPNSENQVCEIIYAIHWCCFLLFFLPIGTIVSLVWLYSIYAADIYHTGKFVDFELIIELKFDFIHSIFNILFHFNGYWLPKTYIHCKPWVVNLT